MVIGILNEGMQAIHSIEVKCVTVFGIICIYNCTARKRLKYAITAKSICKGDRVFSRVSLKYCF